MSFAALGLLGAGISAAGTLAGGIAQGNAAAFQAKVSQNNAIIAQQNATRAAQAGEQKAGDVSQQGAANLAAIKAAEASNGLDVNSGSNVNVQTSARGTGQLNTLRTANEAQQQVYGYRATAVSDEAQSELEKAQATEDPIGAGIGAAGTLFGNASTIGGGAYGKTAGINSLFS